jgi:hypothetical protein
LPQLFGATPGKPLQVEVPAVRVLFELLGFLLNPSLRQLQFRSTLQQLKPNVARSDDEFMGLRLEWQGDFISKH